MSLLLLLRPRTSETPPPPPSQDVVAVSGGGAGWANPKLSSLTKTRNLPGVHEFIAKEDDLIIETVMLAIINETLQ